MQLDSFTLLIATSAAMAFLGLAFLYFWNRDRRSTWLLWWCVPFIIGGASALSYAQPDWATSFGAIAFGNAVRIFAIGLFWQGARVFERRPPMIIGTIALAAVWIGLCFVPAFLGSMAARVIGASLANCVICWLAAWELWRGRAERLPSRTAAIIVFLSFSAVMLVRIVGVDMLPFPMGALPLHPLAMAIFDLAVFVHAAFMGLLLIALTKERLELEQRHIAMVDPLTGLMNRRAFMKHAERAAGRTGPGQTSLLVLDLDGFKSVNDRYGHDVGDRVLVSFATIAEANARPGDLLFRMGGEEFCFILPDTDLKGALAVAERIRQAFAASGVETQRNERVATTVSIGIAVAEFPGFDIEVLLAAADAALYEAKARGRNRIVVADRAPSRIDGADGDSSGVVAPLRRSA